MNNYNQIDNALKHIQNYMQNGLLTMEGNITRTPESIIWKLVDDQKLFSLETVHKALECRDNYLYAMEPIKKYLLNGLTTLEGQITYSEDAIRWRLIDFEKSFTSNAVELALFTLHNDPAFALQRAKKWTEQNSDLLKSPNLIVKNPAAKICEHVPEWDFNQLSIQREEKSSRLIRRSDLAKNDERILNELPAFPWLFAYGSGDNYATCSFPSVYVALPYNPSYLPSTVLNLLKENGVQADQVPIYLTISDMPFYDEENDKIGWKDCAEGMVFNYFTHGWVHPQLIKGQDMGFTVASGIFEPYGVAADTVNGIGINQLQDYNQYYHSAYSGNMARFRLSAFDEESSSFSAGWFLSISRDPSIPSARKALIEYKIINKNRLWQTMTLSGKAITLLDMLDEIKIHAPSMYSLVVNTLSKAMPSQNV